MNMILDMLKLFPLYQAIRFDIRKLNYFLFEGLSTKNVKPHLTSSSLCYFLTYCKFFSIDQTNIHQTFKQSIYQTICQNVNTIRYVIS